MVGVDLLYLFLYVDDIFVTEEERFIDGCKQSLALKFEMKDIGPMHCFLGLEVWQEPGHIFLG
jgi:hypothetical protein